MNEYLPYEQSLQQQLNDLPLPDENLAWADMKRRLEEDDEKRGIVWWRRGCLLWGFLLLLLLTTGWFLLDPEKWFRNKMNTTAVTEKGSDKQDQIKKENGTIKTDQTITEQTPDKVNSTNEKLKAVDPLVPGTAKKESLEPKQEIKTKKLMINDSRIRIRKSEIKTVTRSVETESTDQKDEKQKTDSISRSKMSADSIRLITTGDPMIKFDSVQKPRTETVVQTKSVEGTAKKPEEKPKDKIQILFSTGLGIHQQLPIAGQKLTPYNSLGRKGSLADYIPSLYLKIEKEKKWFGQTEFRYGAPQYTKEFTYRQKSVADSGANPRYTTTTSSSLKKTFYHQLPVTFNYFIRPNWSIGTGLQWNKFKTAVSEKTVTKHNNFSQQDSLVSKILEPLKKDSATEFAKNYFQLVLETQYQWRRFSFGAKYSFGLEPYIRFTLPGQAQQKERNNAVQVFIRYQLWKQKN